MVVDLTPSSSSSPAPTQPRGHKLGQDYLFPRNDMESQRLDEQHNVVKMYFDGLILHPSLPPLDSARILDSATGTALWLREVQRIYPRSTLMGFDLSDEQFPRRSPGRGRGPLLFVHDARRPLPPEHIGQYDFIHQRFCSVAYSKDEWRIVLRNLMSALRPGGYIQIVELGLNDVEYLNLCESFKVVHKAGLAFAESGDREFHMATKVESYLSSAGFTNIETLRRPYIAGFGAPAQYRYTSADVIMSAKLSAWEGMRERGIAPKELDTPEKLHFWVDQARRDVLEYGMRWTMCMAIGQKPSS